jgi:hypothetical protein
MKRISKKQSCCEKDSKKKSYAFWLGIVYGLIPHAGCIAFIIFAIFGVTMLVTFLKPILLNPYLFYILLGLSFVFTTISAIIYLKINASLSLLGIKRRWRYLSTLYISTILINLFMFMVVFPYATNVLASRTAVNRLLSQASQAITIQVAIPCSGHAPLITEEIYKINGIRDVKFQFPDKFVISFDFTKTSREKILSLGIFNTYKAIPLSISANSVTP